MKMTKMQGLELKVEVRETLQKMMQECINDMVSIGIPVQANKIEGIYLDKFKSSFAMCRCRATEDGDYTFVIVINEKIIKHMQDEVVVENVKNSIYHELLHTCPDCQNGHNDNWLEFAVKCDNVLGTHTRVRKNEKVYLNIVRDGIKVYRCEHCGFEYQTAEEVGDYIRCPIDKELVKKTA